MTNNNDGFSEALEQLYKDYGTSYENLANTIHKLTNTNDEKEENFRAVLVGERGWDPIEIELKFVYDPDYDPLTNSPENSVLRKRPFNTEELMRVEMGTTKYALVPHETFGFYLREAVLNNPRIFVIIKLEPPLTPVELRKYIKGVAIDILSKNKISDILNNNGNLIPEWNETVEYAVADTALLLSLNSSLRGLNKNELENIAANMRAAERSDNPYEMRNKLNRAAQLLK